MSATPLTWLLAACAVLCNASAQLLMKRAAVIDGTQWQAWLAWPMVCAVLLYGLSFALTALVFARFPLSLISPLMAGAIFALIALFSVVFLGETLDAPRIGGMVLVLAGIALLARSA